VGDEKSDPELMHYLEAEKKQEKGQFFKVSPSRHQTLNQAHWFGDHANA
jgi:hypothetical protein